MRIKSKITNILELGEVNCLFLSLFKDWLEEKKTKREEKTFKNNLLDFTDWDKSSIYLEETGFELNLSKSVQEVFKLDSWNFTTRKRKKTYLNFFNDEEVIDQLEENFHSKNKTKIGKIIEEWFLEFQKELPNLFLNSLFIQNVELQEQLNLVKAKLKHWGELIGLHQNLN